MIEVQNAQLLASQEALETLSSASLRGVHALHLKEVMEEISTRLQRLQEVQQDLMQDAEAGEKTQEEANEEWAEVLEQELEIDEQPLPRETFEGIEISAQDLMTLDWLIADEDADG